MIRVQDLYPPVPPVFKVGDSPLTQKYANTSSYAKVGQGHQTLIVGDTYIAGEIPPIVEHDQCINIPKPPTTGTKLFPGAYVFVSNVDLNGAKHYIKDFEASYDFVSVFNDLSSRRRQLLPLYTTDVNKARIFRVFSSEGSQGALKWDAPIILESDGMWLNVSALNYRVGLSGMSDGFPGTESFYQVEGELNPQLLYATPTEDAETLQSGQLFRLAQTHYPVLGVFGCNWCLDAAGQQDLNIISNSRRVARSTNTKWYNDNCFMMGVVILVLVMIWCLLLLMQKK